MDQRYNEKVLINKGRERKTKCMRQQKKLPGVRIEMKGQIERGVEK